MDRLGWVSVWKVTMPRGVESCDGRLRLRTGQASRRFVLAAEAHQQFAGSLASDDLLLTYSVKSGSVAIHSGHLQLLSFGLVEERLF
jgi:hypothetical protein